MAFTKLETCLADTKIWQKDLRESETPQSVEDLFIWMRDQLMNNVAPFLEGQAKASMEEIGEAFEAIEAQGDAIDTIIERSLEKDPARRYASASEMAEAVTRALG